MCIPDEEAQRAAAPRSPWRRILKEKLRPRLSRKVVNGARVNLNKYWSKFEELTASRTPLMTLERNSRRENEINDNLTNELYERKL